MLRIALLSLLTLVPFYLFAQKASIFVGEPIEPKQATFFEKELKSFQLYQLDSKALKNYLQKDNTSKSVHLKLDGTLNLSFVLEPFDIRSKDYVLRYATEQGVQDLPLSPNKTYKGYPLNIDGKVRLTVEEGFIYGLFELATYRFFIEPANRFDPSIAEDVFVVYNDKDVIPVENASCAAHLFHNHDKEVVHVPHDVIEKSVGECYTVELAFASDFSIFDEFGSVASTETWVLGVINNVQSNYDDDFADEIQFQMRGQFVSTCASCDPWTGSSNAVTLLTDFGSWANGGAFGVSYDLAGLWTNRNIFAPDAGDGVIGVAWTGAICTNSRYTLLEKFSSNAGALRSLVAHEFGHSFNSDHDPGGNAIMAPFLNITNEWSNQSINMINAYIASTATVPNCFSDCESAVAPPVAAFNSTQSPGCAPVSVTFQDQSSGSENTYLWTFPGGIPNTSSEANPTVVYNVAGVYDVSLQVSNSAGTDVFTQVNHITVQASAFAQFNIVTAGTAANFQNLSSNGNTYLWTFGDGNSSTQFSPIHDYGTDGVFTVTLTVTNDCGSTSLSQIVEIVTPPTAGFSANTLDGCAPFQVEFLNASSTNATTYQWEFEGGTPSTSTDQNPIVTYNSAGTFDVNLTVINSAGSNSSIQTDYVTIGTLPSVDFDFNNTPGALNVSFTNQSTGATSYSWNFGDGQSSTAANPTNTYAEAGTYTVTLNATNDCGTNTSSQTVDIIVAPTAGFTAQATNACSPATIQFTDQSTNNTNEWSWTFEGGTPNTSTAQNPSITYSTPGIYTVSLIASNEAGESTVTQTDYITIEEGPNSSFTSDTNLGATIVNFTNTSTNADSYSWNFGNGQTSTSANPSIDFGTDGTYTVVLTAINNCGTTTSTETITIVTAPTANFSANTSDGCAPLVVTFNDLSSSNVTAWSWFFEGATPNISTAQNPTVTFNNPGSFNVSLTTSNAAGQTTSTQNDFVVVDNTPTASFSIDNFIGGTLVNFNNTSINADSYSWDFGDGTSSNQANDSHDYGTDGVYTVTLTASNACGSTTISETISIVTPPTAAFSASTTEGCAPFTVTFNDLSSDNVTNWSWTFEGGTPSTSTAQNPTVTFNTPGIFDVTLTASNTAGEAISTQSNFIISNIAPTADFEIEYTLGTNVVNLNNNSIGATSFNWDFGNGQTSTAQNPSISYANDGTYTILLTATNDCGSTITSETITIITTPTAGFTASNTEGCAPRVVNFTDQSSSNATAWSWTFEGGTPSTSTAQNPTVSYSTPGVFSVSLVVSNEGGSAISTIDDLVMITGAPTVDFTSVINNLEVSFNNLSTGATSYLWEFGDDNTSTDENPVHTYANDGIYLVTLNAYNACDTVQFSKEVSVGSLPNADFSSSATQGCTPLSITFTDLSSSNTTGWNWTFEGGMPATSTEQNPTVLYLTPGEFDVTLIASNIQGSNTVIQQSYISVGQGATAEFLVTLEGNIATFTNFSTFADTYLWDFGDNNTSTEENPVHTYAEDGTYVVSLIASNECGDVLITKEITVISLPVANFTFDNADGCAPLEVNFTSAASSNTDTWNWTFEGGVPSSSTEQNPTVIFPSIGTFDVTLIVGNEAGMDTLLQEALISTSPPPVADFEFEIDGTTVTFTNLSEFGSNYAWNFGGNSQSTDANPTFNFQEDGIYEVQLVVFNDCGESTISKIVTIVTPPSASFTADETSGCAPFTVQFSNTSSANSTSIKWTFPGGNPGTSTELNPVVSYATPGTYNVSLQATNDAGESIATEESFITVLSEPDADFIADPIGFEVFFFDNSIFGTNYAWDFDDGATSTEMNPSHTYELEGDYEVQLIISNECGTDTIIKTVTIDSNLPFALFTAENTEACAPHQVQFINQSSENTTDFQWTFEGGEPATSTEVAPLVSYNTPGVYQVTLIASNAAGSDAFSQLEFIVINDVPTAGFEYESNGFEVSFTNTSESGESFEWSFGDDSTSTAENPVHLYEANSTSFTVQLITTNSCGSDTISQEITIEGEAPVVGFESSEAKGCAPLTINFTDSSIGEPTTWNWSFPGGEPASSQEQNPEVTYASPGLYSVSLEVGNPFGSTSQTFDNFVEIIDLPTASFDFFQEDLKVVFESTSTGENVNYLWLFGDGNQSQEASPTHIYENTGMYTVQLLLTNECGTDTSTQNINLILDNIIEVEWLESINLFPNPNDGNFSVELNGIQSKQLKFRVLNVLGQEFYIEKINVNTSYLLKQIEVKNLAAGVYFLEIEAGLNNAYYKIVVE